MKAKITLLSTLTALLLTGTANAQNYYCVQSPDADPHFLTIDISTGNVIDSIGTSFGNITIAVDGFNGMAKDPITGDIYVAVKDTAGDRRLGTINPVSGVITNIGVIDFNVSSITFDGSGNLYGMAGNDTTSLYAIDKTSGSETLIHDYATAGDDGEAICVNTTDGLLYRYDGGSDGVLTTLDLTNFTETIVDTLSNIDTWGPALYYNASTNDFVLAAGETFYTMQTDASIVQLGDIASLNWSGQFKGIVKVDYTSTEELEAIHVNVYPNPSNGTLFINTDADVKVDVVTLTGQFLVSYDNPTEIYISQAGTYFLHFKGSNGTIVKRVIID